MKHVDKRQHERVEYATRVLCAGSEESASLVFESRNISMGGLYLLAETLFDQGTVLTLTIELKGEPTPVTAIAQVVWKKPGAMGLCFISLAQDDVGRLRRALGLSV
jgi:hypothetical protein